MRGGYVMMAFKSWCAFFILACNYFGIADQDKYEPVITEKFVNTGDAELYVKIVGEGEPLVILHGGPGLDHGYMYSPFLTLADSYKLIFYDQRYSGNSVPGEVDVSKLTIEQFTDDLEHLRREFGFETLNLVGHSWGGLLAMHYSVRYPDLVSSLILSNTAGATSDWLIPFSTIISERRSEEANAKVQEIMESREFSEADPEAVNKYFQYFFSSYYFEPELSYNAPYITSSVSARNVFPVFGTISTLLADYNLLPKLTSLKIPVLIVHGDESDPVQPQFAQTIHEHFRNSEFHILNDCGHFPFIERPDEYFSILKAFLAKNI
jgi:proline iminopeptidase